MGVSPGTAGRSRHAVERKAMSYYDKHVFFCCNQRGEGRKGCKGDFSCKRAL